jgi:hypothetical protein
MKDEEREMKTIPEYIDNAFCFIAGHAWKWDETWQRYECENCGDTK